MIRRPPRSTLDRSSAASDVYKRQDPDSQMGPVVNPKQCQRVLSYLDKGKADGAECILEGGPAEVEGYQGCLLYTSPSPRDRTRSRMPSSA